MSDPLSLPFDVYQRYRLVADILGRLRSQAKPKGRGSKRRLTVLDVGGRTAVLREFDKRDAVALVDIEPLEGVEGLVQGNGASLPFKDDSFDVVCAFDTLEHVPARARKAFVSECARVASSWVVLAGPYDAPAVVEAEKTLRSFLKEKLQFEHRYLQEHQRFGLPKRERVEAQLRAAGARVTSLGHANLERWLAFLCVSFYLDLEPSLRKLAESFFRFYNERLYASDHAEPVYRHAVIAALNGADLPDLEGLLEPPVAPKGALKPFARLSQVLLAFDRRRAAWVVEEGKFKQTIETLEADLKEHGAALEEAKAVVEEKDAAYLEMKAGFEADLKEHGAALEEAKAAVEEKDAAYLEMKAELEGKLALEQEQVSVREAEQERLGESLREALAEGESLRNTVEERDAQLVDRDRTLEENRESIAGMEAEQERLGEGLREAQAEGESLRNAVEERDGLLADRDRTLAENREAIAGLEAEQERLGESLRAALAEGESLRHAVAERDDLLADRDRDLGEHREVLAELREVLAARDKEIVALKEHCANLEAHLADRNAELKRWPMAAMRRLMWLFFRKPPTV